MGEECWGALICYLEATVEVAMSPAAHKLKSHQGPRREEEEEEEASSYFVEFLIDLSALHGTNIRRITFSPSSALL